MDGGECYFTAEAVPQIRSEVADEFGLFQVMDQSTGAAATGTVPLWFRNGEMVVEGSGNELGALGSSR